MHSGTRSPACRRAASSPAILSGWDPIDRHLLHVERRDLRWQLRRYQKQLFDHWKYLRRQNLIHGLHGSPSRWCHRRSRHRDVHGGSKDRLLQRRRAAAQQSLRGRGRRGGLCRPWDVPGTLAAVGRHAAGSAAGLVGGERAPPPRSHGSLSRVFTAVRNRLSTPVVPRLLLAGAFMLACHKFEWAFWRTLTTGAIVACCRSLGLPMERLGPTVFVLDGTLFYFTVGCALLDIYCGMVALLWDRSVSWRRNLVRLSAAFALLFLFNLFRQVLGFIVFHAGAPWWLAHELPSGVIDFLLLYSVLRWRLWARTNRAGHAKSAQAPISAPTRNCLLPG